MVNPRSIPLGLVAVTFLVFSPALLNGFVHWDDAANLFDNPSYRGLGWTQLRWMATSTLMGHYSPLPWLTFGLDYTLWGMTPLGYHLTNILIHSVNAALFYFVAIRLLRKATNVRGPALRVGAIMATLFFALHPLRAESVAWASGRRDVLSGCFFLLTILMYLKASDAGGRRRQLLLAISVGSFALALLSKSIVMTLPLVLVLLDLYPLGRLRLRWPCWRDSAIRTVLKEKLPYLVLGLTGALISYWAVASNHLLTSAQKYPWPARIAMTAYSLGFYVTKTIVPTALTPLYELPGVVNPREARFVLSGAAVVAVSAALLALRRRWPAGLAVWVSYCIILGPVSGIIHMGFQLAHDRYSYLSCLGWALLVGGAVGSLARRAAKGGVRPLFVGAATTAAMVWILALGTLTWYQTQIWHDTETLWRHAVESDPACAICQDSLALALSRRGLLEPAKERYEFALALRPDLARTHENLGVVLQAMGDLEAAMRHFRIALADDPDNPYTLANISFALMRAGRPSEAIPYLEHAYRSNPNLYPVLASLGVALAETGRADEALGYLLRASDLKPREPSIRFSLTRTYLALGQPENARREYEALAKLDTRLAREIESAVRAER